MSRPLAPKSQLLFLGLRKCQPASGLGNMQKDSNQNFSTVPWGLVTLVRDLDLLAKSLRPTFRAVGVGATPLSFDLSALKPLELTC